MRQKRRKNDFNEKYFLIESSENHYENQLLGKSPKELSEFDLLEELQKSNVIFMERLHLQSIVVDLITDVKHPISSSMRLPSGHYMKIRFQFTSPDKTGEKYICVIFENASSVQKYKKSKGRSWHTVKSLMKEYQGRTSCYYDEKLKIVTRKLFFPYIRKINK